MRRIVTAKRAFGAWAVVVFAFLYLPILVMAIFAFDKPSAAALASFHGTNFCSLASNQMDRAFYISDLTLDGHDLIELLQTNHRQVVLNSSSAAFSCDSIFSSSSFLSRIAASKLSFRVSNQS